MVTTHEEEGKCINEATVFLDSRCRFWLSQWGNWNASWMIFQMQILVTNIQCLGLVKNADRNKRIKQEIKNQNNTLEQEWKLHQTRQIQEHLADNTELLVAYIAAQMSGWTQQERTYTGKSTRIMVKSSKNNCRTTVKQQMGKEAAQQEVHRIICRWYAAFRRDHLYGATRTRAIQFQG